MTVDYREYNAEKQGFFRKHKGNYRIETSAMDRLGRYSKSYMFADGAIWYECMSPETVRKVVEINKALVDVEVKMFRTEFFDTDNSCSRYYYEKY